VIKLLFSGKQILIASLVFILLANTTNLTFPNAIGEKEIKDLREATEENEEEAEEDEDDEDDDAN
jgi:hypothetical protein